MLRSHPAKPEASALVALSSTPSTVTQGIQTTRPLTSRPSTVTQKEPGTATVTQEEEASTSPSGLSTVTQEEATTVTQEVTTVTQDAQPTVPQSKLIFAQTLFRHGARAPNKKFAELKELFPRGKGQLTDRGYNHSFLLGRFLRKRYVETGFLSGFMKSTEMKWLARQVLRCESTASTVGSGMFQTPEYPYLQVPIVSNDAHFDIYLNADFPGCKEYKRIMGTICPLLSGNYKSMQDWILGGVLDAFSLHKPLNFHEEPGFNSMILIELKEKSGNPFVKFWFKPEEITKEDHKLLDLTPLIPGCNRNPECPLEDFQNCCDSVRITNATITKICKFKP
uniref:ABC transporter domain-containing protein n=1 Tax=Caenorhabditis tropicalis TaxID=1561998 RepID=A0A1I7V108_9PELO